ncbi:predicted GPI-anchored protein 58 [Rhinopithecus roxellana]|uniref:predicted GPI-anchored protein 58 n=1 Tax=Rhinopithecus roxellana TaxID=61622 RepID=UPI001237896A|nr:predicted GPI-anchored protein 58 [Rhinopithecus roxellana]
MWRRPGGRDGGILELAEEVTLDPATRAPRGRPLPFKIAVPEQRRAAVAGRALRGLSGSPSSPPPPPCSQLASVDPFPQPRFNQTHWDGPEQAPGTRNAAPATTLEPVEPRAPAPPSLAPRVLEPAPGPRGAGKAGSRPARRDAPAPAPPAPSAAAEKPTRPA